MEDIIKIKDNIDKMVLSTGNSFYCIRKLVDCVIKIEKRIESLEQQIKELEPKRIKDGPKYWPQ